MEEKEKKEEEDDQRPAGLLSSQLLLRRSVYEVALHPAGPLHPAVLTWTRAHLPSRLGESPPGPPSVSSSRAYSIVDPLLLSAHAPRLLLSLR